MVSSRIVPRARPNTLEAASISTSVFVTRCCGPRSAIFRNDHPTSAVSTSAMLTSTSTGEMASEAENIASVGTKPTTARPVDEVVSSWRSPR